MKKVTRGQRLNVPAEYFNNFIDASEFVKRQQDQLTPGEKSKLPADVILIKNASAEAVDRWGALGIGEPLITPDAGEAEFSRRIAFKGETLDADHAGKFAIAQEPIAIDAIGRAKIAGVTIAVIELVDELHDTVDIYTDEEGSAAEYKLMSAFGGSGQILWVDAVPGSGGLHLAVIRFGLTEAKVLVRNDTGFDIFSDRVLKVNEVISALSDKDIIISGVLPDNDVMDKWVILPDEIKAGATGRGIISGHAFTRITVQSEEDITCGWSGGSYLTTGVLDRSARIIWKESGTGLKKALIRIGGGGHPALYVTTANANPSTWTIPAKPADIYGQPHPGGLVTVVFNVVHEQGS